MISLTQIFGPYNYIFDFFYPSPSFGGVLYSINLTLF